MIDQFAIFTAQGQLLFQYASLKKRFSEQLCNKFIHELISRPPAINESKFATVSVDSHTFIFRETKATRLFYVASYASAPSLTLNHEAEQVVDMSLQLWDSLGLDSALRAARKEPKGSITLEAVQEELFKFEKYFTVKYESMVEKELSTKSIRDSSPAAQQLKKPTNKKATTGGTQKTRRWNSNGMLDDSNVNADQLDFSPIPDDISTAPAEVTNVNQSDFGSRTEDGQFLIKEIDNMLSQAKKDSTRQPSSAGAPAGVLGFLRKKWLGNKTIDEGDLHAILEKFKKHLIGKNVAPAAADYLTSRVSEQLVGLKTASWTSVEQTARDALEQALISILTPGVSVDLLHEIQKKVGNKVDAKCDPYVFSIVGVNGVGKSTNLSKLAFWLLQNKFKVLIVACDTFRSGAVEQLRVHVENLAQLTDDNHVRGSKNKRGKSGNDAVELFEAGYGGSDLVTKIAKQAIKYAREQQFDVVLMDTAGRRHNDATLMSPLKSFADQAKPDKIIMVGEALVGTDSVQQAKNFNQAFGKDRNLDFFIISKCDTVGEMLGTMVNMVYATGIPILFIGVGQTYTDLRTLSVTWAVNSLLS
ncbi:AAL079Cp [Eremothecium gossypii ATCC 10895]|uniref:Signal recognition particle receptor subunit alpha homolog n=1 Tax=Eremothecium gossypii (strain ATCC 10895 / CBS 109.51 / FGSC 9923 / NRRL Y-1056) TaxID=284811 RepID=Q75F07_EREGS|nr:AAL079Cp [Eremothecium gossypii ATCC 10895]AAS50287.2 AAL079Cp [Eremothecium gossypii ATCC 10895]AEY94573.1 FAAL079Cp [Eremothecium gossypii FDAG1]